MFLDKYLSPFNVKLVYGNYDLNYIELLEEDNFISVFNLLKKNNFYFIEDLIVNYLELFTIREEYVYEVICTLKKLLGMIM